jgi:Spy/CpxP family protein refolding chaperone
MNTKVRNITTLAGAVLLGGALMAAAQDTRPARSRGGHGPHQRLVQILGLSEEQQATWKSLSEQHRTDMQPLREEGKTLRHELKAATDATKPDPTKVGQATLALKQHREKVRASREAFVAQLDGVLTPEQKTKFEALRAARRGGPGGRGGFRGGSHGPKPGGPSEG